MTDADQIALDAAHKIEALPSDLHEAQKTARIQLIVLDALAAQPEYLSGCFHKLGPDSCQNKGGCQSEACDHYNKTEYRPRMTLLARDPNVLYPKVET